MLRGRALPRLLGRARSLIVTVSPFGDIWSEEGRHGRGKPRVMYQSCQQCVWILESGNLDSTLNSMALYLFVNHISFYSLIKLELQSSLTKASIK